MKAIGSVGGVARILALALPLLAMSALIAANSGSAVVAVVAVTVALAAPPLLQLLACRAARRIGSPSLPRRVWIAVSAALWLGLAGGVAMGQHFLSVQSGPGELLFLRLAGAAWLGATVAAILTLVFAVAMTVRLIAAPRPALG
jgi:hypothetical protein